MSSNYYKQWVIAVSKNVHLNDLCDIAELTVACIVSDGNC